MMRLWHDEAATAPGIPAGEERERLRAGRVPGPAERSGLEGAVRRELAPLFEVDAVLACGSHSVVYAARERDGGRRVALRVLGRQPLRDAGLEARMQHALAVAALDHPHVVPLYRSGTTASVVWYSMKFIEGRSLAAWLRERGPLELSACLRIAEQVASALAYAHRRGVMHGDVRPANVLLDDRDWALVTDFVIGRLLDGHGLRRADAGAASRAVYRAPDDAAARHPTPASDQYALAATVWECLTGRPPDQPGPSSLQPPGAPGIAAPHAGMPPHVSVALRRALAPDPAGRYTTVLDFAAALSAADVGLAAPAPLRARRPGGGQRVLLVDGRPQRRRPLLTAAAGVLVSIVGWAALRLPSTNERPAPPALPASSQPAPQPPDPLPPLPDPSPASALAPAQTAPPAPPTATQRVPSAPRVPAALTPGRLVVSSVPWGQLFIDDRLVGNTPKDGLAIGAGMHRVRIVRAGYRAFITEIDVPAGREIRLVNIVLEPAAP